MYILGSDGTGYIVYARFKFSFQTTTQFHVDFADESKSFRVVPVLSVHVHAGAILLVFYYHKRFIQGQQRIILINEQILVAETHIFLSFKDGIFRILLDYFSSVYQLFVPLPSFGIEAVQGRFCHSFRERSPDDISVFSTIQADDACILIGTMGFPEIDNRFHCIIGHIVVRIDTGIQFGIYIPVCGVVGTVHSLILLVNVPDTDFTFLYPSFHQCLC